MPLELAKGAGGNGVSGGVSIGLGMELATQSRADGI